MFSEYQKKIIDKLSRIDNVESSLYSLLDENNKKLAEIQKLENSINTIIKEKSIGFPWLADAFAEFFELCDLQISDFLERKLRPAKNTADRLKEIAKEKRVLKKEFLIAKNFVKYYESLFPWITDYVGENLDELLISITKEDENIENDPVKKYITPAEYKALSTTERNQKALDRYWQSRKENWIIGRDYERYIGYLYEKIGYKVKYQGILEGKEDLGRDLICEGNEDIVVVQCKYWAKEKTIHENHINQLFGTTVKYIMDNFKINTKSDVFNLLTCGKVTARLITSTQLSETARKFADSLSIQYQQGINMDFNYPCIKCNISKSNDERIYHLPFDQQYDKTNIESTRGESYVKTVAEAEKLGFRRAWRWKGDL